MANDYLNLGGQGGGMSVKLFLPPTRDVDVPFTPSTRRPVFATYSVNIVCAAGDDGTVALSTSDGTLAFARVLAGASAITQCVVLSALLLPGRQLTIQTSQQVGAPTFELVNATEVIL